MLERATSLLASRANELGLYLPLPRGGAWLSARADHKGRDQGHEKDKDKWQDTAKDKDPLRAMAAESVRAFLHGTYSSTIVVMYR